MDFLFSAAKIHHFFYTHNLLAQKVNIFLLIKSNECYFYGCFNILIVPNPN